MNTIPDEVLKRLADDESDFAEGDVEYNTAIKVLALRELLRRTEIRLNDMEHNFQTVSQNSKYWYDKSTEYLRDWLKERELGQTPQSIDK